MPARPRPARQPKGVTFTVAPAPGLTRQERLERQVRALEVLLRPRSEAVPEPGDGSGDRPPRRPA